MASYQLIDQSSKKIGLYFGSSESPRTSLLGFSLLMVFFIQIFTGILWFSAGELSPALGGLIVCFHRFLPSAISILVLAHVFRALMWQFGIGSRPLKSGLYVLAVLFLTVSTGYMASGGEAGFWGCVISFSPLTAVVLDFFNRSCLFIFDYIGIASDFTKIAAGVIITGATSITTSIYAVSLILHTVFGILLLVYIYNHTKVVHGSSSLFGFSSKEAIKSSLAAVVESKDFKVGLIVFGFILVLQTQLSWLLRLGNSPILSTEVKAPNKATTELYLSSVYDMLRQFPLTAVFFLIPIFVFILICLVNTKHSRVFLSGTVLFIIVLTFDRSVAGFITQDFYFIEIVLNQEPVISKPIVEQANKTPCKNWLEDPNVISRMTLLGNQFHKLHDTGVIEDDPRIRDPHLWSYLDKTMSLKAIDSRASDCVVCKAFHP